MKKSLIGAGAILVSTLLSACATSDVVETRKEERQYVTGSNVPKKDRSGVVVATPQALENATSGGASGIPASAGK
ncbi:MAG: hypothetical protein ABI905_00970 [Betaproteobacteria bacterium]